MEVQWLWYPYIPYGKLTVIQGDPGEGKSTFMLNVAALVTRGGVLPDGWTVSCPQTVLYQCSEDDIGDTIKPRLIEANADCSRIAYIVDDEFELTLGDERLGEAIRKTGARLLVLDPIQAFLPQDGDMQSVGRMRSVLRKLANIAASYKCAIVLVGHMNKMQSAKNIYRGLGSIDIVAIARSVLMISRSDTKPEVRYVIPIKSSLAPEGPAIGFSLSKTEGFQWIGECRFYGDEHDNYEIIADTKRELAVTTLRVMLKDRDYPSIKIFEHMSQMGVSRRTLFMAKKDLNVESYRKNNVWFWRLPSAVEENGTARNVWEEEF